MIDLRLWRISLLAVPLAVLVAMFSLQETPRPREAELTPDAYEGDVAAELTRELAEADPEPLPGSESDRRIADLVQTRFEGLAGVELSIQDFEQGGKRLRNVIAVLPGSSERQIAVVAPRDVPAGNGAASSISSTAVLLEIAASFSGSTHRKTLVFVSADGASLGAAGARRFASGYTDADQLDAVVAISQPAAQRPSPPLVVPWSIGPQSTAIELVETAAASVAEETERQPGNEGPLRELFRLALPSGLGEQGPLVESGLDAVRISSSGELPPAPSEDGIEEVDDASIERFGRATVALLLALDVAPSPLRHGPDAYIGLAGNLLPGWALTLIALSLLLPALVVVAAGVGASARSPLEAARALAWSARAAAPFAAGLLLFYLLTLVGVVPDPPYPFDPRLEGLGVSGAIGVALCLGLGAAGFWRLRPLRRPPPNAAGPAAPVALGLAVVCVLLVAAANPYLALLLALGLNAWVPAASAVTRNRAAAAGLIALGLVPVAAAAVDLAARLGVGIGVLESLLLMVADGQIGFGATVLGCALAGSALALVALAGPAPAPPAPELRVRVVDPEPSPRDPSVYW